MAPTSKPSDTTKDQPKPRPEHNAKTMKAIDLIDKGVSVKDAHKLATGIENPHPNSIYDLKKKYDKHLLTREPVVKLASKVYVETMKMKPVETDEVKACPECKDHPTDKLTCPTCKQTGIVKTLLYPSHTNRLAAATAVMDRVDPVVKQNLNLNLHSTVDPVDLSQYMSK